MREILEKNKVVAGAKAGAIAPIDVELAAGPTGACVFMCIPGMTRYMYASILVRA